MERAKNDGGKYWMRERERKWQSYRLWYICSICGAIMPRFCLFFVSFNEFLYAIILCFCYRMLSEITQFSFRFFFIIPFTRSLLLPQSLTVCVCVWIYVNWCVCMLVLCMPSSRIVPLVWISIHPIKNHYPIRLLFCWLILLYTQSEESSATSRFRCVRCTLEYYSFIHCVPVVGG